jgi:hypothetical protein
VVCLVGDNCAVNQSMARIMKVPFLAVPVTNPIWQFDAGLLNKRN